MAVLQVTRAYVPKATTNLVQFFQLTGAQVQAISGGPNGTYPYIVPVRCDSRLIHRKVWAWIWTAGTVGVQAELVAKLNGAEVWREPLINWGITANVKEVLGFFGAITQNAGSVNEQIFSQVGGTSLIGISPRRLNISADEFSINVITINGSTYDAGVMVQSQQGI